MLLLALFAGCLMSCAAQTTFSPSSSKGMTAMTTLTTETNRATTVLSTSHSQNNFTILETAVKSSHELNETTLAPVLDKLHDIIQELHPDTDIFLTVKNITRV